MMSNRIRWLALLLTAQVVLAIALLWQDAGVDHTTAGQPLLNFDAAAVDGIEIGDGEQTLSIEKVGEGWQLPGLGDFPADSTKVGALLSRLQGLAAGHPLATTAEAAERFKVAEDNFVRRLRLRQGGQLVAELYLGETSGVRRVYGRLGGSKRVHALDLALHQASDKAAAWWDRDYLHQDPTDLRAIELGPVRLQKTEDQWNLAGLAEGEALDQSAVDELVKRVTTLSFQEVVTDPSRLKGTVLLRLVLETTDGKLEYAFHTAGEAADPLLTLEGRPYGLRIARFVFDALAKTDREGLLAKAAVPADGG